MFGGYGVYHDSVMIALVAEGILYLKTDEETRPQFAAAGCTPCIFESKGKTIEMSYWSAPEDAMDSAAAMTPQCALRNVCHEGGDDALGAPGLCRGGAQG